MQLSILGCPDKKRFRPYVKRAALFYASQLMSKKVLDHLYVQIKFNDKIDVCGYAEIREYNLAGKPRGFEIEINSSIGAAEILKTIAHEMAHVKQYVYCETNDTLTKWKDKRVDSDTIDYWVQPWEIEAHGYELGLFQMFAIKEKLWEVFEGVRNPENLLKEAKPLGWKI
jgi:hypothetical protein